MRHWLAHKLWLNIGRRAYISRRGRLYVALICSTCGEQRILQDITDLIRQG